MPAPLAHILNPIDVSPCQAAVRPVHPEQKISEASASLISYKRVPKACTQCRRDKSRCDRARPCNGCVRKGRVYACFDGCVACRRGKLSCDGSRPCISCVQHGRECIEDDPSAIAASHQRQKSPVSASATPRRIKPRPRISIPSSHARSKLRCVACKRDNTRCTGGMTCRHCTELGEKCIYISRPPKLVKQRCALCRTKNKKCDHVRPCVHCVRADVPCIDLPRKGVGRGTRVKRACVGCRADKIQCEEARPCGGCKKKNVECMERDCNACLAKGDGKCASCTRQDNLDREECETSSTASSEEENDNFSGLFPSSPTSPLTYTVLSADAQGAAKPHTRSSSPIDDAESRYEPAVTLNNRLEPPHRLSTFASFDPYDRPQVHLSTHTRAVSPDVLSPFSIGFSLSVSALTSHMRTRPVSDGSEE
ncbi:hypothetical protein JB92DRAFT_764830 [Gautieria morchelliformis]|nr:hypothetical protein JB92DRAFT_764830 [Gautieria morchelliformis]